MRQNTSIHKVLICMLLGIMVLPLDLQAQNQIIFKITKVPKYTPVDDTLYLCNSLDEWALKSPKNKFRKLPDGTYQLAVTFEEKQDFQFKINRGTWDKVEGNIVGEFRANRDFIYSDSLYEYDIVVKSWQDIHKKKFPAVLVKVTSVPENTPFDAKLFLTGTFNNWDTSDPDYELRRLEDGSYVGEVYSGLDYFEYKFSRGTWESVEVRKDGGMRSNRIYKASHNSSSTIVADVEGWQDLTLGTITWKVIFLVIALQALLLFTWFFANKKDWSLLLLIGIFMLGILLRFFYSHYDFFNLWPKGRILPAFTLSFISLFFLIYLERNYSTKKRKFLPIYFIALIPVSAITIMWSQPSEAFKLKVVNDETVALIGLTYFISIVVGLLYNLKIKAFKKFLSKLSDEVIIRLVVAVRYYWIIGLILLAAAVLAYSQEVDVKLVIDWFENLIWLAGGVIILYIQWIVLSTRTHTDVTEKKEVIIDFESDDYWKSLKEKLENFMMKDEVYKNPKLSLKDLSTYLGTNTYYVSKLINEGFEKSYTDYVNNHRINAFVKNVQSTKGGDKTFLYHAFDVGFNSKSAFNRAFKKATGKTPSEYFSN
jgi:AraC-like DNA-binding protein